MDRLIKETLADKASKVELPAGAWERVRQQIDPNLRRGFGSRYRLGARLEFMAAVAVLLLVIGVGMWRSAPGLDLAAGRELPPGLTITETRLAAESVVAADLLKLRELAPVGVQPNQTESLRLEQANEALKPFGYRLTQATGGLVLYMGSEVVLTGFTHFSTISVSASRDDFIFLALDPADRYWLVQAGQVQEWAPAEVMRHRFQPPVYVGDDLVAVRWEEAQSTYAIWRGDQQVFTVPLAKPANGHEVKRLVSWAGHWVLEVQSDVYVDGASLRQELGYDELFEWRLLGGRPFYLFRKGSLIGVAYDGQVLPHQYDQVPHDLCCEPAQLNPAGGDLGVQFYGLRGGTWHWVEVALSSEAVPQPEARSSSVPSRWCLTAQESRPGGPLLLAPCQARR